MESSCNKFFTTGADNGNSRAAPGSFKVETARSGVAVKMRKCYLSDKCKCAASEFGAFLCLGTR